MKKLILTLLIPFFCFASSVGEDNNQFALALFSQFQDSEDNLAFSPYGIFSNLSLLYYGADEDTAREIQNTLHLSETGDKFLSAFYRHMKGLTKKSESGYQLSIANALFPHQGTHFLSRFQEVATKYFDAKLQSLDYTIPDSALSTINNWVQEKTEGKIQNLVSADNIDASTRLILANAVYFQGIWSYPLRMEKGTFHLTTGKSEEVDMLYKTHAFPYYEDEEKQCVALPFARDGIEQPFLECLIVLPKEKPLSEIEKKLSAKNIDEILYQLEPTPVDTRIPKFCFSNKILLNDILKNLGMQKAFTYQANFSKIDGMKDLFLSQVLHETYFYFNEFGVTASSATTSNMRITSFPPTVEGVVDFTADHPFLFFLVDYHSRAILFMGRVTNPSTEGCDET